MTSVFAFVFGIVATDRDATAVQAVHFVPSALKPALHHDTFCNVPSLATSAPVFPAELARDVTATSFANSQAQKDLQ